LLPFEQGLSRLWVLVLFFSSRSSPGWATQTLSSTPSSTPSSTQSSGRRSARSSPKRFPCPSGAAVEADDEDAAVAVSVCVKAVLSMCSGMRRDQPWDDLKGCLICTRWRRPLRPPELYSVETASEDAWAVLGRDNLRGSLSCTRWRRPLRPPELYLVETAFEAAWAVLGGDGLRGSLSCTRWRRPKAAWAVLGGDGLWGRLSCTRWRRPLRPPEMYSVAKRLGLKKNKRPT
jgi:hypothetical protein